MMLQGVPYGLYMILEICHNQFCILVIGYFSIHWDWVVVDQLLLLMDQEVFNNHQIKAASIFRIICILIKCLFHFKMTNE